MKTLFLLADFVDISALNVERDTVDRSINYPLDPDSIREYYLKWVECVQPSLTRPISRGVIQPKILEDYQRSPTPTILDLSVVSQRIAQSLYKTAKMLGLAFFRPIQRTTSHSIDAIQSDRPLQRIMLTFS